jgi:hypothetical protein
MHAPGVRSLAVVMTAGCMAVAASALATPPDAVTLRSARARAARSLSVHESAQVRPASSNGNTTVEVGPATGTLHGTLHFSSNVAGAVFSFTFTLQTGAGEIGGSGRGRLSFGRPPYASFAGSGRVTHGTGRYAHVSGSGRFSGAEDRLTHVGSVQVQADLRL